MGDDDPPPEQVKVPSKALNIIYKYYKKNLWKSLHIHVHNPKE